MSFLKKIFNFTKSTKPRSVVFYRQSYYHFYFLSRALQARGWDAIVVNLDSRDSPNTNYYHGEDLNLYDPDPVIFSKNISSFVKTAADRFKLMHFAGDGLLCFDPQYAMSNEPTDIVDWKKKGNKIAYTISGCNSGTSQSSVTNWSLMNNSLNVCDRCVWQDKADVCNDEKNLLWGKKVQQYCDLIFSETLPALDYMQSSEKVVREPVTICMDKDLWSPDLIIPKEHVIPREQGEILIYHSVGNYDLRNSETRNIKGTPFIFDAIERLKQEGHRVRLIFITNKQNKVVRYYQAQADIIVDQLNYGRYGATAREGMMLGKPVICYINPFEYNQKDKLTSLEECPLVSATEQTIYETLKDLVTHPEKREYLSKQGRAYAVKWHSAEACAERYEKIYDALVSS